MADDRVADDRVADGGVTDGGVRRPVPQRLGGEYWDPARSSKAENAVSGSYCLASVKNRALTCLVCGHTVFRRREVKLNSTGVSFFGYEWANESVAGLICAECGFVHHFAGPALDCWSVEGGWPPNVTGAS